MVSRQVQLWTNHVMSAVSVSFHLIIIITGRYVLKVVGACVFFVTRNTVSRGGYIFHFWCPWWQKLSVGPKQASTTQNQCAREEVRVNCPQSCGLCCMDDPFYSFTTNMVKERDRTWLGRIDTVERNGMVCFVEGFCQVCVRWYVCDNVYEILYWDITEHVDVIEPCCDASTVPNLFLAFFGSLQLFIYAYLTGTMRSVYWLCIIDSVNDSNYISTTQQWAIIAGVS